MVFETHYIRRLLQHHRHFLNNTGRYSQNDHLYVLCNTYCLNGIYCNFIIWKNLSSPVISIILFKIYFSKRFCCDFQWEGSPHLLTIFSIQTTISNFSTQIWLTNDGNADFTSIMFYVSGIDFFNFPYSFNWISISNSNPQKSLLHTSYKVICFTYYICHNRLLCRT